MRIEYGPFGEGGSFRYMAAVMEALRPRADVSSFLRWPTEKADRVAWIKRTDRLKACVRSIGTKRVVFAPVDSFRAVDEARGVLSGHPDLTVVAPGRNWRDEVLGVRSQAPVIPHPLLHWSDRPHRWTPHGDILCVSASVYAAEVNEWLRSADPPRPVRLLVSEPDLFRPRPQDIVREWTPELQAKWIVQCVAAVDVKGDCFWHRTKPDTKATEMLASGLPVAVHPKSEAAGDVASLVCRLETGRGLPGLDEFDRLLSPELHEAVQGMRHEVERMRSVHAVADQWWRVLDAEAA